MPHTPSNDALDQLQEAVRRLAMHGLKYKDITEEVWKVYKVVNYPLANSQED